MPEVNKPHLKPVPYVVGNFYRTQGGHLVRFVNVHNEGSPHETMSDESDVHRYTQRDYGRVTGSCHEYSDPRNVLPTYSIEFVDTLIDEIQELKSQLHALQVNDEDHLPA